MPTFVPLRHLASIVALGLGAITARRAAGQAITTCPAARDAARSAATARDAVRRAAAALGGESVLRAVRRIELTGVGHRNLLEQSERPEGPWFITYQQFDEVRDYAAGTRVRQERDRAYFTPNWWSDTSWARSPALLVRDSIAIFDDSGHVSPGGRDTPAESRRLLALSPERLVLTALDAADLRACADTVLHGFRHAAMAFTLNGEPVRLFLNVYTSLPTAVQITRARPANIFWYPWGDVTSTFTFSAWTLEPGGLRYPRLVSVVSNGQPDYVYHADRLVINGPPSPLLAGVPDSVWAHIPPGRRSADDVPIAAAAAKATVLAPGVVQLPNSWNVEEVAQGDGVVIIEGPMSAGYSAAVIGDAVQRFPGQHVKAVITTSDSWPHIGGLREYVARGIPIYVLDLDVPIVTRLFRAPHTMIPDSLARAPRQPVIRVVAARTTIGSGANRVEVIPYRTETGERQMMVYFPAHRLLYTSDLFSSNGDGTFFIPEYLSEAMQAVDRERLAVDTVFGMHLGPTPWGSIRAVVDSVVHTAH